MDLSTLDLSVAASEGATLTLTHPGTGEDLYSDDKPMTITVLGKDSAEYRGAIRKAANARMKNRKKVDTVEALESESVGLMSTITTGWSGITVDGEEMAFNAENAKELYRRFHWIREQVDAFVDERANFLA